MPSTSCARSIGGSAVAFDAPTSGRARGPFPNPKEQALRDPACVVYRVSKADYADDYVAQFGDAIAKIDWTAITDQLCSEEGGLLELSVEARKQVDIEYANIAIVTYSIRVKKRPTARPGACIAGPRPRSVRT
jgi:hypothetical protein